MARISATRKARLIKRRERLESELDALHDLLDMMTQSDVQNYTIGSRNVSRYKNIGEVEAAIDRTERRLDETEAELGGHRRRAVAVVIRDV